jgi:translation initiation factor RLI1
VDQIPKAVKGTVAKIMETKDERKIKEQIYDQLGACNFLVPFLLLVSTCPTAVF